MIRKRRNGIFIRGLPISSKWKISLTITFLLLLVLNNVLPNFLDTLNYVGRGWVSIGLIALIIISSTGSYYAEGIVIGVSVFAIASNFWDFFVRDYSLLRRQILIGSIVVLSISLMLGEISITNLISIIKAQFGIKKKH